MVIGRGGKQSSFANTPQKITVLAGVARVVIPSVGKAPPKRVQQERERWFRRGFQFRAGIEGRISVLQRRFSLDCCLDHGDDGMGRWVGWGIVTHNLDKIAQTVVARRARRAASTG